MKSAPPPPPPRSASLLAAARRFTILLAGITFVTVVAGALVGLLAGSSLNRGISVALYLVGSFLLIAGVFVGSRGPARLKKDTDAHEALAKGRRVRWASRDERLQTINESAIFVTIGIVLLVLGVIVDARTQLI